MITKSFAKILKQVRTEKGFSQESLSFEAGLHRTYISQLERGLKSPSLETLYKISKALKINLTEFMSLLERELKCTPQQKKN